MKTLLIDGDECAYISALSGQVKWNVVYKGDKEVFRCSRISETIPMIGNNLDWEIKEEFEDLGEKVTLDRMRKWIKDVKEAVELKLGPTQNKFFINGKDNFRYKLATILPYKGQRDPSKKPIHLKTVLDYMRSEFDTESVSYLESDDLLAINQREDTVIVTQDKDLNMVPGFRYSTSDKILRYLEDPYCIRSFYNQILTGDPVDNIPGLSFIGTKAASKILKEETTEEALYPLVLKAYTNAIKGGKHLVARGKKKGETLWETKKSPEDTIWEIANLLYMRRKIGEDSYWYPPDEIKKKNVPK